MVRVISVHHFASQDIHTCEEPLAVTTAPIDKLLIALPQHAVEVRDLRKGGVVSHTFPTVDEVTYIIHCANGNYVATLEAKKNRQGKEASHARIYANWDTPSKVQPMRARIAGRVTPSSQSGANSLEMIELPVKRTPNVIACCQVSGNILVGSHKTLVLYKFHVKTHDISKLRFLDFEETLSAELSFCPSHIALCEDVVSCISKESLHVFRVAVETEAAEERGTRDGSEQEKRRQKKRTTPIKKEEIPTARAPVVISDIVKQASTLGSGHHSLRSKLHADSFPIVVHLPSIVEQNKNISANQLLSITQRAGPFRDARLDMNVKVSTGTGNLGEAQIFHILCLQIHACSRAVKEEFRCLRILPMYVEQKGKGLSSSSHPMHSAFVSQLVSLSVAVTTQQEGYVYHINYKVASALGSQSSNIQQELVSPATVYPFTAPVASISLERSILHALTDTGLETYTGRAGHHLMQLLNFKSDGTQMAYPPVEDPVCLVGLRPFFGVEHLLVSESYLCLLACSEGSSTSSQDSQGGSGWTLYSLQLPSSADLYQDMSQVAGVHRATAPSTYLHLLAEAHVVLGTARKCLNWRVDSGAASSNSVALALPGLEPTPEANRRLERCYQESCALLADHYIMSDDEALWEFAKPYYSMSGLNPTQVVDRFLRMEETKEENIPHVDEDPPRTRNFQGLMYFLRGELPGAGRARGGEGAEAEDFSVEFASQLLELFEQHDPASVSALVLGSATLRQHRMDRVLQVMKRRLLVRNSSASEGRPEPDPQDALALVLLCLQKGSLEQARTVLGSLMGSAQLVQALQAHHGLLFTCSEARGRREVALGFTELALLVAEVQPAALASVLTQLALEPTSAHQLPCAPGLMHLTRAFLTPPCSLAGAGKNPSNASTVLRLFLEAFFSQLPSHYSSSEVSEGACILARSYLACLTQDSQKIKGLPESEDELFGPRLSFLDKMPPFSVDKTWHTIQGTTPPEQQSPEHPNHILIKLQSLLCCARLGRECGTEVLQFLQAHPLAPGCLALRSLCLSPKEATCQLLEHCPTALLTYAKERYISESDWKYLLSVLQKKMNLLSEDSPVRMYYSRIMTDALGHLTQTLALEEFVRVLPGGEAAAQSATFQPFVHACQHVQSANHIRTLIMATGQQLLATLNL